METRIIMLTLQCGFLLSTVSLIQAITPEETKIISQIILDREKVDVQKFTKTILSAHGALFNRNLIFYPSKQGDEERWVKFLKEMNEYINKNAPMLLGAYETLAEISTVIINTSKRISYVVSLTIIPKVIVQEKQTGIKSSLEKRFDIPEIDMSFINNQLEKLKSYNYQDKLEKIKSDLANIIRYMPTSFWERRKPRFGEKEKDAARILFYLAVYINTTFNAMFTNFSQLEDLKRRALIQSV